MKSFFCLLICFACLYTTNAQRVGIGTTDPKALLHVSDSSVLFSGLNYLPVSIVQPPISGKGTRTFWYVQKAAFRTGGVYNSSIFGLPEADTSNFHNWDKDSIGLFSFASGYNTKAKGDFSSAFGNGSFATGNNAAAFGGRSVAAGNNAFAAGIGSLASASGAVAFGSNSTASGQNAIVAGENNESSGLDAAAFGGNTTASGKFGFAAGLSANATGAYTTAIGNNVTASGNNSTALGHNASTNAHTNSFAIGGSSTAVTNTSDNQMIMRFDNYTFWVSAANYAYLIPASNGWAYTSDKTKKEKFEELNGETVLQKISGIPFYSWNFNSNDTRQYRHYGIMAQDFYEAFGRDKYGTIGNDTTVSPLDLLGVAYSGIKALEKRTADLQARNDEMAGEIISLKAMLHEMADLKEKVAALQKR
jgi:hypothetical protein